MIFNHLDPLLNGQVRLAIMSVLMRNKEADFVFLKSVTGATAGNLSIQLNRLKRAGYLELKKSFKGSYPQTRCKLTAKGELAFNHYVENLRGYILIN